MNLHKELPRPASPAVGAPERVRYVEVAPSTGWQTMAKSVREIDVDKVQDCKEDIDTLLVFAGLYSAVLSAFLVETYTILLPDDNAQTTYLPQRIALQTQSYTFTSGHLQSTADIPEPPSAIIPLWASHVNALWFASLIISLAVASFGMLVKQWLREYLAMDWTSPQERLRARQYRKPSLDHWRVFEVAAALPMLLQLSLGLFFLGLCIFTGNINNDVNRTALPLVCAWAAFFAFTALAPLISPRCPYKTPLLKTALQAGRSYCTRPIFRAIDVVAHLFCIESEDTSLGIGEEEKSAITRDQDDAAILLSTDAYMADDNFLPNIIDAYRQQQASSGPERALSFAVSLINNRLPGLPLRIPVFFTVDLGSLSRRAHATLLQFVAGIVLSCSINMSSDGPDWQKDACLLLLSTSPYPLPGDAMSARRRLLAADQDEGPRCIVWKVAPSDRRAVVLALETALQECGLLRLPTLLQLYNAVFGVIHGPPFGTMSPSLYAVLNDISRWRSRLEGHSLLHHLQATIFNELQRISPADPAHDDLRESILILLKFSKITYGDGGHVQLFKRGWSSEATSYVFLVGGYCAMHLGDQRPISTPRIYTTVFSTSDAPTRHTLLRNLINTVKTVADGVDHYGLAGDMLRCTWLCLQLRSTAQMAFETHGHPAITLATHPAHVSHPIRRFREAVYKVIALNKAQHGQSVEEQESRLASVAIAFLPRNRPWLELWQVIANGLEAYYTQARWKTAFNVPKFFAHCPGVRVPTSDDILAQDRKLANDCLRHIDAHGNTYLVPDSLAINLGRFLQPTGDPSSTAQIGENVRHSTSTEDPKVEAST